MNTHIDQDKIYMILKLILSNYWLKQFHGSYYCSLIQTKRHLKIHYLSMLSAIVEDVLKIGDVCWIGLTWVRWCLYQKQVSKSTRVSKNQNTYIVTGVRTQLRLEQVNRHVLFLEWEMHLSQKSKSFGKKDCQHQMRKFCTKGGVCVIAVAQSLI